MAVQLNEQRVTLTADEAHELIGGTAVISRASWYAALKRNEVPNVRVGRRILIPRQALLKWLESASVSTLAEKTA